MNKIILTFIALLLFSACSESSTDKNFANNLNTAVSATPKTSPTPNAEQAARREQEEKDKIAAFQQFVATYYQGWTLKGTDDTDNSFFTDLHITRKQENKIVKVNYKLFQDLDGKYYWVVSKVTTADVLAQAVSDAGEQIAEDASANK